MSVRIAALLTCHNRRDKTIACLRALHGQQPEIGLIHAFVVDAASSDGTAEAIAREFPNCTLISAPADTYWNRGMYMAFATAAGFAFDYYLWLNDDTLLDKAAVKILLETADWVGEPAIVVGSTRDPVSGSLTYGGVSRPAPRTRPLRFELVEPIDRPRECETMNGNCVLVAHSVVERLGLLDARFTHGMGDYDYGLRAQRARIPVVTAPGTVGTCSRNPPRHRAASARAEWAHLRGVKGLPPAEWAHFCRRWAGVAWPVFTITPYVRRLLRARTTARS